MDKRPVREVVNQLVEADFDQRDLHRRLVRFNQSNHPPLAPSEFDNPQSFVSFYEQKQGYEDQRRALQTQLENAKTMYDLAAAELQDMLPANTSLHYNYEGSRQELAGIRFKIMNRHLTSGQGRIEISPQSATVGAREAVQRPW